MVLVKDRKKYLDRELINYLLTGGILSSENISAVKEKLEQGENLETLLKSFLSAEEILFYKSNLFGIRRISLSDTRIDPDAALLIPEELALKHVLIPVKIQDGRLLVAMADPTDQIALDDLSLYTGYPIEISLESEEEIKIAIREFFTAGNPKLGVSGQKNETISVWKIEQEAEEFEREAPVIRLVDSLLRQAIDEEASDIHWEPQEGIYQVRFRIDGLLEVKIKLPASISRSIAARLKMMAGMDVTERRVPQGGRILLNLPDKKVDIRVSTFATVYGEKIVTRILDEKTARRSLAELGMREDAEEGIRSLLRRTHGLILIAGPTGSGKTTMLYALLREVQSEQYNIVSIEDPVEYRIPGVNHSQVNPKSGLDFAGGLRAILRQDPDIIMVGEIRDRETAAIATAAALTGHLVLTTVHTNSAAEALARMLDMDIEPYLLAASIRGVIAQRLVRKLCPSCKEKYPIPLEIKPYFSRYPVLSLYRAKGCSKCRGTGYGGRIGIYEFLPYNSRIKELVMNKGSAEQLEKAACSLGMLTLWQEALSKVAEGQTSWEEIMRLLEGSD